MRRKIWAPVFMPDGSVRIPLTRGLFATIDASDLDLVTGHSWNALRRSDRKGDYAVNSEFQRMHRLIMKPSDGEIVDHRDGDGLNNCRSNLRVGSQSNNSMNRRISTGKYLKGVDCRGGRWRARIRIGGKLKTIGNYSSEESAHAAYLEEAARSFGDWAPVSIDRDRTVSECEVEIWSLAGEAA